MKNIPPEKSGGSVEAPGVLHGLDRNAPFRLRNQAAPLKQTAPRYHPMWQDEHSA